MRYIKSIVCFSAAILFCGIVPAQDISLPSIGSGSSSGSPSSGSSGLSSSGSSNIGSDSSFSNIGTAGTSAASDVDRFQGVGEMDFVGIKDGVPFVGREKPFETSSSSRTSNVRSSTTGTRRTTSSRTNSARRTTTAGSRLSSSSSQYSVRSAATADFKYLPLSSAQRAMDFSSQLLRTPNLPFDAEKIQVNVNTVNSENVATVSGTVASEHGKKIAKQLLLLEPGIDRVENKITVVKIPEL